MKTWYAVMMNQEDNDWGTGSYDLEEAVNMVKKYRALGESDAFVAVIEESEHDAVCVEEIREIEG